MKKITAVANKELLGYFKSPMAYIVLVITISVFNVFFYILIDENREASLRDIFLVMEFMFVFIAPLLAMKVFAEEKNTGTMEFLQTTPTTNTTIVLGKYLGSLLFFTVIISSSFVYYAIIEFFAKPDLIASLTGFLGIWLEGAMFLSIGILISSLTRNQIIAAISSYLILFLLYFSITFIKYAEGPLETIIRTVSTNEHAANFSAGLITTADLIYYISIIGVCLMLTKLSLNNRLVKPIVAGLVVLYIAFLVSVNFLGFKFNQRFDMTAAKQHTLAFESMEIIDQLEEEITMTAFYVGLPPKYLEDLLGEYERRAGGKIATEIIDPIVEIGYAAQFGNIISGSEHKIVVQSENQRRDVDFTEAPLTQEQLNNALIRVTRPELKAYFLTGHGENVIDEEDDQGYLIFNALLAKNNVKSYELLLETTGEIPEDCDILIVAGPRQHLARKEEAIINDYLAKGGDALFLIENVIVTTPKKPLTKKEKELNPSLEGILNRWGLNINDDIVVDLASHASGDVGSPATRNYMSHKAIVEGLDYTFYIRPRSIGLRSDRRKTLKAVPFVLTASDEQSWGETNRMLEIKFDEVLDRPGPVPISYVVFEPRGPGKPSDTRIIVFTDADFLTNAYITQYSNAQMGLNVVKWITESDQRFLLDKKEIKIERLDLVNQQKTIIALILLLVPVLIILCGVGVWLKNR